MNSLATTSLTPILPAHVDATMMSCFRSCPRKFFDEFVLGLRPSGMSIDLHAGAAFAHTLDVVRKCIFIHGDDMPTAMLKGHAAFQIYWGDFEIPEYKSTSKTSDRVWAAVEQYFTQWNPRSDHIQPYMVDGKPTIEFTFAIPLEGDNWPVHPVSGEPFVYAGRFDMLGEYMGMPIVADDKTSGTGHYGNWSERWDLRSQFIGYTWACQQLDLQVDSCVVRGVGILKQSIALAEAIKPYSDDLRAKWLEQLRRDLWRIVGMWNEGYWDYNLGETCTSYGVCVYSTACQSSNPEPWLKTFTVSRWNPVNINPTKEAA